MTLSDPHEFREDVNDFSMCVCGIPALTHDAVMLSMASPTQPSPVETTAGSEQRPDHTGVIRGADEADRLATIADLWDVIEANGATNSRLIRERDEARAMIATDDIELQAKDATIERLWAQLNEATNVRPIRCLACNDPHCPDRPKS